MQPRALNTLVFALVLCPLSLALDTRQFVNYYSGFTGNIEPVGFGYPSNYSAEDGFRHQCQAEIDDYTTTFPGRRDDDQVVLKCISATECMLEHLSELGKMNMGSSSVVLGLLPVTLASFGATAGEITLLSYRRPFLALLLSIGAPAMYTERVGEFRHPLNQLSNISTTLRAPRISHTATVLAITILEYVFVLAAIANVISASIELGTKSILNWNCQNWYYPLIWNMVPLMIYPLVIFGRFVIHGNIRREGLGAWMIRSVREEFTLSVNQSALSNQFPKETFMMAIIDMATQMATIGQLILGTVVFSSLLMVSVWDAENLMLRYAASAIVCKIVFMYEMCGIRDRITDDDK